MGPETAQGLPREGVVAEKFVPSLESLSSLGFEERNLGCPGNFAVGVQKVRAKKSSCAFYVPYLELVLEGATSLKTVTSLNKESRLLHFPFS